MSVVVYGTRGYIGSSFCRELERREIHWLGACYYTPWPGVGIDPETVRLVINAAACVKTPSVDCNEDAKSETMLGNLVFPVRLMDACAQKNIPIIHISTACLYQGDNGGLGWSETDAPQLTMDVKPKEGQPPVGVYVASKELAERVLATYDKAYICRMRLPFDEYSHPRNLLTKLAKFDTVVDEVQSLTHRGDFVKACLDLWQAKAPFGIYNCTNPGDVSYRWLCEQINTFRFNGKKTWNFESPSSFDRTARTIKSRCSLSCAKLLSTGVKMRPVGDAVLDALDKWKESN